MNETLEELRVRQQKEIKELVARKHTKRDRQRMTTRHINEFKRLSKKLVKMEMKDETLP